MKTQLTSPMVLLKLALVFWVSFMSRVAWSQQAIPLVIEETGSLSWSNHHAHEVQQIEWASQIVSNAWSSDWSTLADLPPEAGVRRVNIPRYFRLVSKLIPTNLPGGVPGAILVRSGNGSQNVYANLAVAYSNSIPGDTIFLTPGVYNVGTFVITKPNLRFVASQKPFFDKDSHSFTYGAIFNGKTRINATTNLSFFNIGFMDSSGGDPFLSGGFSTNYRNLVMSGCVFAGTTNNDHNIELIGDQIYLDNCESYSGGHNFAFKSQNLRISRVYTYNGQYSGMIIKGSLSVGNVSKVDLVDITIEGPPTSSNAKGLIIEAYDPGSSVDRVSVSRLQSKYVNMAVYVWPHAGSHLQNIFVSDAESHFTYGPGDYLLQPGATNVQFVNCRSYYSTSHSFVNFGSQNVSLINCFSTKESAMRTSGTFVPKHVNNEL